MDGGEALKGKECDLADEEINVSTQIYELENVEKEDMNL